MLVQRLLENARSRPGAEALVDGGRRVDYSTLADAAMRFAGLLQARGLQAGDRVAIVLPNGIEAVVACYGCWIAGCIAVPMAAQARARELRTLLAHSGARVLVHHALDPEAAALDDGADAPMLRIVAGGTAGSTGTVSWDDAMSAGAAPTPRPESAVASIVYTSGTSGAPKGVTLTHANFAANVGAIVDYLELDARDSVVSVLPFHYSYGASVLHSHLAAGARVVIAANFTFPHLVVDAITRERATGFSGVASTWALLLDRVDLSSRDLSSLRYLTNAGSALPLALARRLRSAIPGADLIAMYGQTEATARLAWLPPARFDDKPGSAGRAIDGVVLEVRDAAGRRLPPGRTGEVWARGGNVMAGYWNDPAATAMVLRDGWLRTGDMGHLDDEGFLFLAGRRSDMIKTGAHRVHPLEVEEAIRELAGVVDVAVAGFDDPVLGQVVKAFVVGDGRGIDANAVRAHCRALLPTHKVPKHVEFVASLPRTDSGKIRRATLGEPIPMQELACPR